MKKFFLALSACSGLTAGEQIVAFAGSARDGSYNVALLQQASDIARKQGATVTILNMNDYAIPIYSAELEASSGMPEKAKEFRQILINHNKIIIASPEHNGSITALLKNAIDWASRSDQKPEYSPEAFKGKKFAIMSASPGSGGGSRGLKHLAEILTHLGAKVIPTQVSVPKASSGIDPESKRKLEKEIGELLQP